MFCYCLSPCVCVLNASKHAKMYHYDRWFRVAFGRHVISDHGGSCDLVHETMLVSSHRQTLEGFRKTLRAWHLQTGFATTPLEKKKPFINA